MQTVQKVFDVRGILDYYNLTNLILCRCSCPITKYQITVIATELLQLTPSLSVARSEGSSSVGCMF